MTVTVNYFHFLRCTMNGSHQQSNDSKSKIDHGISIQCVLMPSIAPPIVAPPDDDDNDEIVVKTVLDDNE